MLNHFRKFSSGIIIKILLGLLILSFAAWGIGDMFMRTSRNATVVKVGSTSISRSEFAMHLQAEMNQMRNMLGENYSPELAKQFNVEGRVLQRLINQSLLAQESKSLGLVLNDVDVARNIRANPAYQDEKGNFDKARFFARLRASGLSEKAYADELRLKIASGILLEAIAGVPSVPDNAPEILVAARQEQRTAALYELSPSLLGTLPAATDEDVDSYYKSHIREFTAPEYRTATYVSLQQSDADKTIHLSADDVKKAYLERIEEFKQPEMRTIDQMLFGNEDAARKAYNDMKNGGKSFEQVAKDANILNKGNLSLGKLEQKNTLKEASEEIFALSKDGYTAPIKSAFGWHIFKVRDILPAATKPLETVQESLHKELTQRAADSALNTLANKLEDAIASGNTLQEAATSLGLKTVTLPAFDKAGKRQDGTAAKEIPAYDKFLDTVFRTDEKTESNLVSSKGGVYYIVRTESVTPEHARPLAEVKAKIMGGWKREQEQQKLAALANELSAAFTDEKTRAETITKYKLSAREVTIKRTNGGNTYPAGLVADIFARAPGATTSAFPLENGAYAMAVVKAILPSTVSAKDPQYKDMIATVRKDLASKLQDEAINQYMHYLASKYSVSVNEAVLKSMLATEK